MFPWIKRSSGPRAQAVTSPLESCVQGPGDTLLSMLIVKSPTLVFVRFGIQ